jgi:DNA polymerase theta
VQCLGKSPEVLKAQKNLIFFAPTSGNPSKSSHIIIGGKSIVSEILMLRAVLGFKKRAMYILPFVSIVTEKA